jgi:hypothetical protein
MAVLAEFLDRSEVVLQPKVEDLHIWQFSSSGQYSANPLMSPCSLEPPLSAPRREFGKVGPLVSGKCRFFMCLVAHNKCWTANQLAKRNLPHPECCPLCYQHEETIDHLLVSYVFTWQVWFNLLQRVGLQILTPQVEVESFDDWWEAASKRVEG